MNQTPQPSHFLETSLGCRCWNCAEALALAEEARGIPGIAVRVIDLDQPGCVPPPCIFAVPTYVLNGRVIALENPAREALLALLQREKSREI